MSKAYIIGRLQNDRLIAVIVTNSHRDTFTIVHAKSLWVTIAEFEEPTPKAACAAANAALDSRLYAHLKKLLV